mgnify:CR=1 FL=1
MLEDKKALYWISFYGQFTQSIILFDVLFLLRRCSRKRIFGNCLVWGAKIHSRVKYNLTIILCKPSHFFCHKCLNEIKAFKSLWRQWAWTFVDKRKAVVESAWTNLNSWTYKERLQNALYNQRNPGGNKTDYRTNTMLFFLLLVTFHPLLTKGKRRMCFHEKINLVSSTWTKQGALFINPGPLCL